VVVGWWVWGVRGVEVFFGGGEVRGWGGGGGGGAIKG